VFLLVQKEKPKLASAMSLQVCPALSLNSRHGEQLIESACHIPDARNDHKCFSDEECGTQLVVDEDHVAWAVTVGYG